MPSAAFPYPPSGTSSKPSSSEFRFTESGHRLLPGRMAHDILFSTSLPLRKHQRSSTFSILKPKRGAEMENGNSRILFITDLIIMFSFFFFVFKYYTGGTMISLKGNILMGLIVIYWFLISVNSNILRINRLSTTITVSKDILIAYSVLSTITIATVAIFDEFRPNDKLILYPLLFGAISSCILRLCYLVISKQCLKQGYRKKSVLLIGGGHAARQIICENFVHTGVGLSNTGSIVRQRPGPAH
jgi:hypothetical protein